MERAERLKSYLDLITRHRDGGMETIAPASIEEVIAAAPLPEFELATEEEGTGAAGESDPIIENAVENANSALDKVKSDAAAAEFTPPELDAAEAIILFRERPALDVIKGDFQTTHDLWSDINEGAVHERLKAAIPSVGRIGLPRQNSIPYAGTGFVVGKGLLMTNRHVAEIFARGLGTTITYHSGNADVDFLRERELKEREELAVLGVRMIHPYWDMALLEIEGLPERAPLKLSLADVGTLAGRRVAVIGYPAYDPVRNDVSQQNQMFSKVYGVKRLQPGMLQGRVDTGSFKKIVSAGAHDCSTLGGNSGSAVIDFETGEVLGVHFGGRFEEMNYFVPAFELARDGRVSDAGVTFASDPVRGTPPWNRYWTEMPNASPDAGVARPDHPAPPAALAAVPSGMQGGVSLTVPLTIMITLGSGHSTAGQEGASESVTTQEALREPWRESNYAGRKGYDPSFLPGHTVLMPRAANPARIAPLLDGSDTLHYGNFSVQMDRSRRLAFLTACNVTGEQPLRRPEPGRDYTRKGLSGLGENSLEKWFADPRIAPEFQLSDRFFTQDDKAFDKGHIVRRDDVAWGASYDALRLANGDTYHVTNCSPQVAQFNQSSRGTDNWGDLENAVLSQAAQERYCLFAGPILDASDDIFVGKAEDGSVLRVRIPRSYWKVVVATLDDGLATYAFVLDQDLTDVELEFAVPDEFRRRLTSISALELRTGLVFPDEIRAADRFHYDGIGFAFRAGIEPVPELGGGDDPDTSPNSGDDEAAAIEAETPEFVPDDTEPPNAFRLSKALEKLRATVNSLAPNRSKLSDGWIGDAAHRSRSSDHNPWVRESAMGIVTAIDVTHDPAGGCDAGRLAESLRAAKDARVKYIIWNRRIANRDAMDGAAAWDWRPYGGRNPHDRHVHISVRPEQTHHDGSAAWTVQV